MRKANLGSFFEVRTVKEETRELLGVLPGLSINGAQLKVTTKLYPPV